VTPALILSLISILAGVLKANPQIPTQVGQVVSDVSGSLAVLFSNLMNSKTGQVQLSPTTIIAAIGGVIVALKQDPNLPQDLLAKLNSLDQALSAALVADKLASQTVDYSTLHAIAPVT
jgi:hypothetical protein